MTPGPSPPADPPPETKREEAADAAVTHPGRAEALRDAWRRRYSRLLGALEHQARSGSHATGAQLAVAAAAVAVTSGGLIVTFAPRVATTPLVRWPAIALAVVVVGVIALEERRRVLAGSALSALTLLAFVALGLFGAGDDVAGVALAAMLTVTAAWLPWFLSRETLGRWLPAAAATGLTAAAVGITFFAFVPPGDLTIAVAIEDTRPDVREGTSADVIEPVDATLEITFHGCLKDPDVTLRLARDDRPVRWRRLVVADADGDQLEGSLSDVLAPRQRGTFFSCYLPLPRLLGKTADMERARTLAEQRGDPEQQPMVALDVRSGMTRVAFRDAQLTVVRGAAPDQEGSPSHWQCARAQPRGIQAQPLGCQGLLAIDEGNRRVFENVMLVVVGALMSIAAHLFISAANRQESAASRPE